MIGTIINAVVVAIMGLIGSAIGSKLSEDMRRGFMKVLALPIIVIGLNMALKTRNPIFITASIVIGYAIGELIGIERALEKFASKVEKKFSHYEFTEGFITASLLFCVGSMAIIGPLQEGLIGDYSIILAKTMLDGIAALFLSSALGIGVAFSAFSILVYQGSITLLAFNISQYLNEVAINEVTSCGGILVLAIGLNLAEISRYKVGNMLPALIIAAFGGIFYAT